MKVLVQSKNVTRIDLLNTAGSDTFKSIPAEGVKVRAVMVAEDTDIKTGAVSTYGYLYGASGELYAGNSASVVKTLCDLIPIIDDPELNTSLVAHVKSGTSKAGKEYLTMYFEEQ